MQLLKHAPAAISDFQAPGEEVAVATEIAHEHLNGNGRGRPPGVRNGEGKGPRVILKRLSNRHKNAISLVLQGSTREEAAEATNFTPEYITMLLQQPLAKEHIANINRALDAQLEGLYGKSVKAIADGLGHADPKAYLAAAKLQLQATGRMEAREPERETAEDVVRAILVGVQVNVNK